MNAARSAVLVLAALTVLSRPAATQEGPAPAGTLAGRVLDAATGQPVAEVLVTLETASPGLVAQPRSPAGLAAVRTVVTGEGGGYRFGGLAPGRYRLRVERMGYRPAALDVDLRRPLDTSISVGLELDPVALEPVRVEGRAAPHFQRAANRPSELEEVRLGTERERQEMFLTPDSRMLTYADVMDGVTLGEGDVFRALQRFPGVGTRDDFTAELWTRGAPWTHTRVTFDGVPLFNPVHAVGILSAISPEVLGAVFFHPGVRSAGIAEGAAGVVDLRSRPGGGDGRVRGAADLSLASAKLALDQHVEGRGAWVVAARRSHLAALSGGLGWLGLDPGELPYVFHDVAGRMDVSLGAHARLEASGLHEEDRLFGDVEGVLERTEARWGNTAGRATLHTALGGLELSHTVGGSRFSARTEPRLVRTRSPVPAWTEPASESEIRHTRLSGELAPAAGPGGGAVPWRVGYDLSLEGGRYDGPPPRYHAVKPDTAGRLRYEGVRSGGGIWAETRVAVGPRLAASPGVRLDMGGAVANAGAVRVSPRLAARYRLSEDHAISLGLGRTWQSVQAIALGGPSVHPAFHASHFWVWPDGTTPAIRADLASLGSELWLGGGWLASGTAWVRRATGVLMPDPTPGPLVGRPRFVVGENVARGVDVAVRRLGARWSTSAGYSWGVSEIEAVGLRYPAPADRHHLVDVMAGVRLIRDLRLTAAYSAMSGAPFTRAVSRSEEDCALFGFGCGTPHPVVQDPNAERTPAYRSLDASLLWTRSLGRAELGAYVQVRNLLGRDNATTYSGTVPLARYVRPTGLEIVWDDRFEAGLPRLPLAGVRVTF